MEGLKEGAEYRKEANKSDHAKENSIDKTHNLERLKACPIKNVVFIDNGPLQSVRIVYFANRLGNSK
jgi:hypothetical protein